MNKSLDIGDLVEFKPNYGEERWCLGIVLDKNCSRGPRKELALLILFTWVNRPGGDTICNWQPQEGWQRVNNEENS